MGSRILWQVGFLFLKSSPIAANPAIGAGSEAILAGEKGEALFRRTDLGRKESKKSISLKRREDHALAQI